MTAAPDFRSPDFLRSHIAQTMAFYHPRAIDPAGGFFHYFKDDGTIYDRSHRHLVSSTRFVFNYAMAWLAFGNPEYLEATRHGLRYLREVHRNRANGGYHWTIRDSRPEDSSNQAYGVAFVLLAYATALKAGIEEARGWMDETWDLLEQRYWEADARLYRDEADADWHFSDYRGQNANMHMCEAMIAAYQATHEPRYLDRASLEDDIAQAIEARDDLRRRRAEERLARFEWWQANATLVARAAHGWRLLLSLNSHAEAGLCFWDAGTLNVYIHEDDLAAGRFDRTRATIVTG